MFGASIYAARIYNAEIYTVSAPAPPAATVSKGRRLVRWLIEMPIETNMLGEYVWQREEEDEIFILF